MKKLLLSLTFIVGLIGTANAQTTFTFKDAAGTTQTAKSFNCTGICPLQVPADASGAAFGVTGNPFFVTFPSAPAVNQGTSPWIVSSTALSPARLSALTNSAQAIKSSAGNLGMLVCGNSGASQVYVQVFSKPFGSVTVGTDTPVYSFPIEPGGSGGFTLSVGGVAIGGTGISAAATTTATGASAPSPVLDCNAAFN